MTESTWKVVMDRHGVTIASDRFQLTTAGAEPTQLEAVIAELQSTIRGTYGQYCGLSRAIEMVGERWGLLVIRDLLLGPKSVSDLHRGLPRIPTELLAKRLKEMTHSGVVRPVVTDTAEGDQRYELTEYGRAVEEGLLALGRWGAISLATPRPEDIVTPDSMMVAMRATFLPDAAVGRTVSFELHIGEIVINARITNGELEVGEGRLPGADAVIDPGFALKDLLTGKLSAAEALRGEIVQISGEPKLLYDFVEMFQLPRIAAPIPA
jgi:DNA-binding HxlR family transcriptional regulator